MSYVLEKGRRDRIRRFGGLGIRCLGRAFWLFWIRRLVCVIGRFRKGGIRIISSFFEGVGV